MTFRERLAEEHPYCLDPKEPGGCAGCPDHYGYEPRSDFCPKEVLKINWRAAKRRCKACWDREMKAGDEQESCRRVSGE